MKSCRFLALVLVLLWLAGCGGSSSVDRTAPQEPAERPDGSPVDGVITAVFDPSGGEIPFPNSLLLSGSDDLTLNIPVADPGDFGDPAVAMNALDGFSTVAPWTFTFSAEIDPDSVVPGSSVRFYEVSFATGTAAVTGVNRELVPGQEFVATVAGADTSGLPVALVKLVPQAVVYSSISDHNSGN